MLEFVPVPPAVPSCLLFSKTGMEENQWTGPDLFSLARARARDLPGVVPAHHLRPGVSALSVHMTGRQEPALPLGVTKLTRDCIFGADQGMLRRKQERPV